MIKILVNIVATALFAVATYRLQTDALDQPVIAAALGWGFGYFGANIIVEILNGLQQRNP